MKTIENEFLRVQNGSKLYGLATPESDDDYISLFIEPPEYLFSGRTKKTVALSELEDSKVDGQAYALRHFLGLTLSGNPTTLGIMFVPKSAIVFDLEIMHGPETYVLGERFLEKRDYFLSRGAGKKFMGYMNNQLGRMQGIKNGHKPNRPELVDKYGFDTKYAYQIARLAIQGIELMTTGTMSHPLSAYDRQLCLDIREGKYTYDDTLEILKTLENQLYEAYKNSPLPEEPNYKQAYNLSRRIHEAYWASQVRAG